MGSLIHASPILRSQLLKEISPSQLCVQSLWGNDALAEKRAMTTPHCLPKPENQTQI